MIKTRTHDIEKVKVNLSNSEEHLTALIDVICCPEFIGSCTLESLGLKQFQKRIELLAGRLYVHKLRGGKMKFNIRFGE